MQFDEERIQQHFAVWEWLISNFGGLEDLKQRPLITPTQDLFPHQPAYSQEYAEAMFETVKDMMGISDWPCRFEPLENESPGADLIQRHMLEGQWSSQGPAGTFQWTEDEVVIRFDPQKLGDAIGFVATLSHELCHYLLATAKTNPPGGWKDHELHTDMACSFMGFGIFQCNAAFNYRQWADGQAQGWSYSQQGYLSEAEHAYALALFCRLTETSPDQILPFLKTNPKAYFKMALQDLEHRRDELIRLSQVQPASPLPSSEFEVEPNKKGSRPELTREDVARLTFKDPANEALWAFYEELVEWTEGDTLGEREFEALKILPDRLRNMILVIRFEILQKSGGLQAAALLEDSADIVSDSEKMLDLTAAAYEAIQVTSMSQFLKRLRPAIASHLQLLEEAERADGLEDFMSPLDRDEMWEVLGYPHIPELRRQVRDFAPELVFPSS
ncbi:MAG: hypothetical protein V4599_03570 [Verrucomicrobiota bacterium]